MIFGQRQIQVKVIYRSIRRNFQGLLYGHRVTIT
jgi:hypothetical protein